jgi:NADH-quinone oxidoreductase subunit K
MIPAEHVLLLAILQFTIGLIGLLTRRSGMIVLVSALIMLNGVLIALGAMVIGSAETGAQSAGVLVLAAMVAVALVGSAVLYSIHRFRRAVALDEHDRMRR